MPAGGVGCPPLSCLGRLFTHDDEGDDNDFVDDDYGDSEGDDAYTRWLESSGRLFTNDDDDDDEDADGDDGYGDGDVADTTCSWATCTYSD